MGRHVGWIALYAGIAGGAAEILIPEVAFSLEAVCDRLRKRHAEQNFFSTVVVAEGARPADEETAAMFRRAWDARRPPTSSATSDWAGSAPSWPRRSSGGPASRPGRRYSVTFSEGGSPTAFDRVLATRFGAAALAAAHDHDFGKMVALQAGEIVRIPLHAAVGKPKRVDAQLYCTRVAALYLGCS